MASTRRHRTIASVIEVYFTEKINLENKEGIDLGGLGDDGIAPAITLAEAVQAQLVTLMARSLLALVDPSTEQNPAGGDNDRRSDEP